jgi:hypothetical protein
VRRAPLAVCESGGGRRSRRRSGRDPLDSSTTGRETALLIADAHPLCSIGTGASVTYVSGVIVATRLTDGTIIPGARR